MPGQSNIELNEVSLELGTGNGCVEIASEALEVDLEIRTTNIELELDEKPYESLNVGFPKPPFIVPVISEGQTSFSLATPPSRPELSTLFINGIKYYFMIDYSIDGSMLNLSPSFPYNLTIDDCLEFQCY